VIAPSFTFAKTMILSAFGLILAWFIAWGGHLWQEQRR
jgi:hypothetical protein